MEMKCTDGNMMKMKSDMDSMSGSMKKAQKEMVMNEMGMAIKAMKAKHMKECSMHMEKASKEMMR